MQNLLRVIMFLIMSLSFAACGQSMTAIPSSIPSPTMTSSATFTPIPSPTSTAAMEPTSQPEFVPPTLIPTIDPTVLPELLSKAFSIQAVQSVNGHNMRRITGWKYGFGGVSGPYSIHSGYYWLDASHLLLYPSLREEENGFSGFREVLAYQPAVINLENGYVWLPDMGVYWSSELGMLITTEFKASSDADRKDAVFTYTFDGERTASYQGKLTGISPSRTKILIEDTWIDLRSGKTVNFEWDKDFNEDYDIYFPQPLWSSDEIQVYTCCYKYGNARTGESFTFLPNEVSLDGEKIDNTLYHAYGEWVLNDSHLLIQFDWFNSIPLDFIPLFDIKARTLHSLNTLAGIPTKDGHLPNCQMASAAPDGQSIWVTCYSGDYLVDLSTFDSVKYPSNNSYDYPTWSADGDFAWMSSEPLLLLSVPSKKLSSLPVDPGLDAKLWWHTTDPILAYISEDGQKLVVLDAQTTSHHEIALSTPFQELAWSPTGDRIALLAKDGSLWQLDYPSLKNLEQLTPSSREGKEVTWSPNGNSIAFISGSDIYIVETAK